MKLIKIKSFKIPLIIFLSILAVLISGILALYTLIPEKKIITFITSQAEKATGKKFNISSVDYGLFGIELKGVKVVEPSETEEITLLEAESIILRLSLLSLIRDKISINHILIESLKISIEFYQDGESNISRMLKGIKREKSDDGDASADISGIELKSCEINLVSPPPQVGLPAGRYLISASINLEDKKNILIDSCDLTLPDGLGRFYPVLKIDLNGPVEITGDVKIENGSLDWVYKWKKKTTVPFMVINGDVIDMKIKNGIVTGKAVASSTLKNSRKLVFVNGECEVDTNKSLIFIKKSNGSIEKSTFLLNYLTLNFSGNLINFSVSNLNSQVNDLTPILSFLPDKLYGGITGGLTYNGVYNGKLGINSLGYDAASGTVSGINTVLNIENSYVKNEAIPMMIAGYPATMSVVSLDQSFSKFFFSVKAEKVKLSGSGSGGSSGPTVLPIEINGRIEVADLEIGSYKFKNAGVLYSAKSDSLTISRMSAEFMGGTINLQSGISLSSSPPTGTADINIRGLKIQELIADNKKIVSRMYGTVSGRSKLNFTLSGNPADSINGNIEFTIDMGKLVDTGIQHGLGIWLSELKYKLRDLEFNRIYGNASIKSSNIYINSFIFNSQNIRLNIKGAITKDFKADNLGIDLEFTDHFISDLTPAFILGLSRYKEGTWYVVPFSANGDIMEPANIKRIK